jgi:hypothetical protein
MTLISLIRKQPGDFGDIGGFGVIALLRFS